MDSNRVTEGVGKKIVEALKQQSDIEIEPVDNDSFNTDFDDIGMFAEEEKVEEKNGDKIVGMTNSFDEVNRNIASMNINNTMDSTINSTILNFKNPAQEINLAAVEEMELPANVAVLRQLITKIPAGVSKQTGALIIKQTMEALGISMTNVLQEAQQVQEKLTQSVKECQTNVLEYKKQINILEVQAQKYQRQFAAINDIISLFIQTGN